MEQQTGDDPQSTSRAWMPAAAGIMSIVSGAMGFIAIAFLMTFAAIFGPDIARDVLHSIGYWQAGIPLTIIGLVSFIILLLSLTSIVGGICAIRRKSWGLALAGAICAIFPAQVLGIIAVIFVAISKKEFE